MVEEREDFALIKFVFDGLNNKHKPENLRLKLSREKRLLWKNSVMLVHQNENILPESLEEANKVFDDLPNEIRETFMRCRFQC